MSVAVKIKGATFFDITLHSFFNEHVALKNYCDKLARKNIAFVGDLVAIPEATLFNAVEAKPAMRLRLKSELRKAGLELGMNVGSWTRPERFSAPTL